MEIEQRVDPGRVIPIDSHALSNSGRMIVEPSGRRRRVANVFGADHLFESRQAIPDPARVIGRRRALSSWHASHGLLVARVQSKPKVTGGHDLRLFERDWG
jgi:hypothetical protein